MPIPKPQGKEKKSKFMARCISDPVMRREFPDINRRIAVCLSKEKDKSKSMTKNFKYFPSSSFISVVPVWFQGSKIG